VSSRGVFATAAGAGVPTLVPEGSCLPPELSDWMFRYDAGGLATALEHHRRLGAAASEQACRIAASRSWDRIAMMHHDLYLRFA
jgi:hypothetical protein